MRFAAMVVVMALAAPEVAHAHPGGLDAAGCHTDSSTGVYHCHGGGSGGGAATDPLLADIGGYVFSGIGVVLTVVGFACAGDCNDAFLYSALAYGLSELLAIVAFAMANDPVHLATLSAINGALLIADIVGWTVFRETSQSGSVAFRVGPDSIMLSGAF